MWQVIFFYITSFIYWTILMGLMYLSISSQLQQCGQMCWIAIPMPLIGRDVRCLYGLPSRPFHFSETTTECICSHVRWKFVVVHQQYGPEQ